jgi:hypothetical protein
MNDRIFVVAGTRVQYDIFIRKKCEELYRANNTSISLSNFIYVDSIDKLRGYSGPHGYFIGTWCERKDIEEILFIIKTRSNPFIDSIILVHKKWKQEKNLTT